MVGLPIAAYLTWQGKLIEGRGVTPSIPVAQPPEHLICGERPTDAKSTGTRPSALVTPRVLE